MELPVEVKLELLTQILSKVTRLTIWLTFAVVHLTGAVLVMGTLWWFQVSPDDTRSAILRWIHQETLVPTILGFAAFLGISGWGAFWAYARAWRWMLRRYIRPAMVK